MLTRKQHQLLSFIDKTLRESGISPSYDEMKAALDLKSKSGIHRLITGLEERGFIRRLPHRARALEVLKLPENMETGAPAVPLKRKSSFAPNVISGGFKDKVGLPGAPVSGSAPAETLQLPLYGRIAAGTPIEALRDSSRSVDVPAGMLASSAEHYALEVDGDSMVEAGIHDGDTVIIQRSDTAENGSIVVALVEGSEVTLKRLRRKGDSIALEPANKNYETRIFGPDQVQVQGRLVGLMRTY
jgi:repressor LexA